MIVKKRTIPLNIYILEALLRRLPKNYVKRPFIFEELTRRKSGFRGEKSLDFYLKSFNEKKYWIFHDLNLPDGQYNCQVDTFLLSKEFSLIVEVKNMTGKLVFDTDNDQFIQIIDGKEKGYTSPIAQAERHQTYLKKLFPSLTFENLIVFTNPHSILSFIGKNSSQIKQRVCKAHSFLKKYNFTRMCITEKLPQKKNFGKPVGH